MSTPPAMPASIWPSAILFATTIAASRLVPQARCTSRPGVSGDSPESSSDSRARFHWLECFITAPATTSPRRTPFSAVLVDHRLQRRGEHFLVADARVGAVCAREGYARAADDCDAPGLRSDQHVGSPMGAGLPASARMPASPRARHGAHPRWSREPHERTRQLSATPSRVIRARSCGLAGPLLVNNLVIAGMMLANTVFAGPPRPRAARRRRGRRQLLPDVLAVRARRADVHLADRRARLRRAAATRRSAGASARASGSR